MIKEQHFAQALEKGVLSIEQVAALKALAVQYPDDDDLMAQPVASADEENFRFLTSFNDIFVTIGIALFLGALTYIVRAPMKEYLAPFSNLFVVVASWFLARYFTLKKRMALPSIVLLLIFTGFTFWLLTDIFSFLKMSSNVANLFSAFFTSIATYMHWRTFRVPITVASGAATLITIVWSLAVIIFGPKVETIIKPFIFISGLITFGIAMRFDAQDTLRQTRYTDIAFWLHLLAAPMIVHPLVIDMVSSGKELSFISSCLILGLFTLLGLIALLVDRRAILVSSLSYAGYALAVLIGSSGFKQDFVFPATIFVLGAAILLLSAGWTPLRAKVLRHAPAQWKLYLPQAL